MSGNPPVHAPALSSGTQVAIAVDPEASRFFHHDAMYAGARQFAPPPGRALVRPIVLLLCIVFAVQSRAGAAAPELDLRIPLASAGARLAEPPAARASAEALSSNQAGRGVNLATDGRDVLSRRK